MLYGRSEPQRRNGSFKPKDEGRNEWKLKESNEKINDLVKNELK